MNWIDVGFQNNVEANKILTVSRPSSAPIKRMIKTAKENNMFIDLTEGKKTRSIIIQSSPGGLVLVGSYRLPQTIIEKMRKESDFIREEEVVEGVTATYMPPVQ